MNTYNQMFENIEAIIFDMDGTLIDSMWVWEAVDEEFHGKHGLVEPEGFYEGMEGKSYTEVAEYYLTTFPQLPYTEEEIRNIWTHMAYEKYTCEVPLKDGVRAFIETQKKRGIKLGIATSNGRELVDATLRALDIEQYFDSIHTACEVEKGKPSPDIYLLVANDLEIEPEKCLVFEDVPMGILAGKNAGMHTCAIYDKYSRNQEEKKREMAEYYIESYRELENGESA